MTPALASALMPLARLLDPETAHRLSLAALRLGLAGRDGAPPDPILATRAFGRTLPNPIGLAAGFDKNAEALAALGALGFGFVEAGTATLRPQPGNPRPRMFRLDADEAAINRMGFNSAGIEGFAERVAAARARGGLAVGANVGINKDCTDPPADYAALVARVAPAADYVTINISSPNTPGLRDLQGEARLAAILDALPETAAPLYVKLAPDLAADALGPLIETCVARRVSGLIISNTTIARPGTLRSRDRAQAGGLSGRPLFAPSTAMLARAWHLAAGRLALIGAGGVFSAEDALAKIEAGASLVQLYTGFAFRGPGLIPALKGDLAALLRARGYPSIAAAVGARA